MYPWYIVGYVKTKMLYTRDLVILWYWVTSTAMKSNGLTHRVRQQGLKSVLASYYSPRQRLKPKLDIQLITLSLLHEVVNEIERKINYRCATTVPTIW